MYRPGTTDVKEKRPLLSVVVITGVLEPRMTVAPLIGIDVSSCRTVPATVLPRPCDSIDRQRHASKKQAAIVLFVRAKASVSIVIGEKIHSIQPAVNSIQTTRREGHRFLAGTIRAHF
jgi:hypothetical protein